MKQRVFPFAFLFFSLPIYCAFPTVDQQWIDERLCLEGRVSLFFPGGEAFKEVYGNANPAYELLLDYRLSDCWKPWLSFIYIYREGESEPLGERSQLNIYSPTFGLSYVFPLMDCWSIETGGGAIYSYLSEKSDSRFLPRSSSRHGWGGIARLSANCQVSRSFIVSVFSSYQQQKLREEAAPPENDVVNISGGYVGLGLGLLF